MVQVIRDMVVPTWTEISILCRVTTQNYCLLRLIESFPAGSLAGYKLEIA